MKKVLFFLIACAVSLHSTSAYAQAERWTVVKEFVNSSAAIKNESARCRYRLRYEFVDTFYGLPQTKFFYASQVDSSPLGTYWHFPVTPSEITLSDRLSSALGTSEQQKIKEHFFDNTPYGFRDAYLRVGSTGLPKLALIVEGHLRSEQQLYSSYYQINNAYFTLEKSC